MLVFVVPQPAVQMAIGKENLNLKKLSDILGKRIRVVAEPNGIKDLQHFVTTIVSPIQFEKLELLTAVDGGGKEAVITTGGRESKAMLIGRGRAREAELRDILEQYFGVKVLRIN